LREAFSRIGIEGASTHSFRRTALTQMSNAGIPLRIIQEISGHSNLEQLQRYLDVKPDQVKGAIASLSMLSYTGKDEYARLALDIRLWKWLATVLSVYGNGCATMSYSFCNHVLQLVQLCLTACVTASYGLWKWLASSSLRLWKWLCNHVLQLL
jgi:hypothetical protein